MDENPALYTSLKERLEKIIEVRKQKQRGIFEMMEQYQTHFEKNIYDYDH